MDQSGADCMENPINDVIHNNQPLDDKAVNNCQNSQILDFS